MRAKEALIVLHVPTRRPPPGLRPLAAGDGRRQGSSEVAVPRLRSRRGPQQLPDRLHHRPLAIGQHREGRKLRSHCPPPPPPHRIIDFPNDDGWRVDPEIELTTPVGDPNGAIDHRPPKTLRRQVGRSCRPVRHPPRMHGLVALTDGGGHHGAARCTREPRVPNCHCPMAHRA